jgi:ribonuclease HI
MFKLYTDGSSTGRVGEGGWAFVIIKDDQLLFELSGGEHETTNNRMELSGVIEGLRYIYLNHSAEVDIIVYSDSQYVVKGALEWFPKWEKDIEKGKKIKNQDLWLECKQLIDLFGSVHFEWIEGHSGIEFNERCDYLAKQAKAMIKQGYNEHTHQLRKS